MDQHSIMSRSNRKWEEVSGEDDNSLEELQKRHWWPEPTLKRKNTLVIFSEKDYFSDI